ncbi:MAG: ABC transporter ATP-binding protein [Candidatus Pacebacteria bacterium]|jgi:ATP-binding cassette subfamily B protein|nr:ABC transporter ATP-binding protein [Candidatus Paceibacterota bacterium]
MKNEGKSSQKVSVGQIMKQFWIAIRPKKSWFFISYLFYFFANVIKLIVPLYYKDFFDILSSSTNHTLSVPSLNRVILIILFIHLGQQVLWQIATYYFAKMQAYVMPLVKQNSFNYLIEHSYSFFANNFSGSLMQKINRFSRAFESLSDSMAYNLIPLIITIVGSIWITWFVAPIVSIILMIWVILFTIFSVSFSKWKLKYDTVVAEADSKSNGYLSDAITNNNAVSLFTGHTHESSGYRDVSNDQAKKKLFSWRLGNITDVVQILLISFVEFFIFYFAIKYWSRDLITVGTFVMAQTYILGVAERMWGLNKIIRNFYEGIADSKEMVEILLTKHEVEDKPGAQKLEVSKGEIIFNNVSFNFSDDRSVLKSINLTIKPGQKIAIIGPSGAGKTTLVRLMMRLYNITNGSVSIDGQDISNVTQDSLRHNISLVPQDPVLFHRTLMENIRYGRRDATDLEVMNAARLAHCSEFIEGLPLKYETYVGERGIKLSGGERQRVAIARAILKKAPILIFDEATSSLDSYSESLIQDALENLMKDCTTIVIAHRLSTVKKMDRIIAMKDGEVVEDGTHEELANKDSGLYKKLWDLQVSGFMDKNQ